ncbi:hypothetical protein Mangalitsa_039 [Escherichia phage Mangalitsa]|uniref:Uncharacterized protein n=1 Tax=Escherichia phage Mangalitsa TaxID=2589658 RepID=A0A5B9N8P6_9CAUD|nr:hypothetical protein HWC55_gp39 [Escherichia phage Mangalitsa]QEG07841.1 hypothetical protein Mangalitsa_039 [Escherichia phage Mangalitsa]
MNSAFTITQSASDASSLSHRAGFINSTNPLNLVDRYVGQTLWPLRGQRAINAGKTELTFSSTFV